MALHIKWDSFSFGTNAQEGRISQGFVLFVFGVIGQVLPIWHIN